MRILFGTILVSALAMQAAADVNVREFGAIADGKTDSTAAFQKAIDSLGGDGGEVYVPAGRYVVGELHLKSGVAVRGVAGYGFREANSGTVRHYCINANYFDRSGTAGLQMTDSANITFTGNQFWRSGRPQWKRPTEPYSAHAVIRNCRGITFSSNNMNAGRDDDKKGEYSPRTGLVLERLTDCVVMGNTAHRAYIEKFIDDRGGHVNTVVRDNVGSPMGEPIVLDVGVDE